VNGEPAVFKRSRKPVLVAAVVLIGLTGCGSGSGGSNWPLPNYDASSTRAQPDGGIDRSNVAHLHVVWRFPLHAAAGQSGDLTATPVVADGVVYVQDLQSTVDALDLHTGRLLWRHTFFYATSPGPNGVAVANGRVYGATDIAAFALSAKTGKLLWSRQLTAVGQPLVDTAPLVAGGTLYTSTIGLPPNGRGTLFALDAATGHVRWRFSTIEGPFAVPGKAGGGGAWNPPSAAGGDVYWGTANPYPYGGSAQYPNGGAYAGPALFTDSLLALVASSGKLDWYDQVTPHDVRDYDFQLPPILVDGSPNLVIGAGKAGLVVAWDRDRHRLLWETAVGVHRNDLGPLPDHRVAVCPGLLGGVETAMAYSDGTVFVPVVNLCMEGSSTGFQDLAKVDVSRGTGELVALDAKTGATRWTAKLAEPPFGCATVAGGVVFTTTFDGMLEAFDTSDGTKLWSGLLSAGSNSCPALAGGLLLVGAGITRPGGTTALEAFAP
jgi:outer membrane protein assembly factor BamB